MADEETKKLYGDNCEQKFPVDSVDPAAQLAPIEAPSMRPKRLDAYQFGDSYGVKISFGMRSDETAKVLREVADRIESREYLLQEGNILTHAQNDDYPMTYLTLKFHQKKTE